MDNERMVGAMYLAASPVQIATRVVLALVVLAAVVGYSIWRCRRRN